MIIVMLPVLMSYLTACNGKTADGVWSEDTRTVLSLDSYEVSYDEFRYFYMNFKRDYDGGDDSYWAANPQSEESLLADVLDTLRSNYALKKMADDFGVELTDEEKKACDDEVTYTVEAYGGLEQYKAAMAEYYMTGAVYRSIVEQDMLETKLREVVTDEATGAIISDDATVEADIRENFVRVKHILIMNDDGEDPNENYKLACELSERINAGEDFDAIMEEYSDDADMDPDDGYYFTRGEFLESFEDAAFELNVGDTSGVIESVNGYHIIRRLELDDAYIDENFNDLRDVYKARCFNEYRDNVADGLDVTYTDVYGEFGIDK